MHDDGARKGRNSFFPRIKTSSKSWVGGLLICIIVGWSYHPSQSYATTIIIVNKDSAGEGFNDQSPFSPVGGNAATTLGQARLNAFEHAANILAQVLVSSVVIEVDARIDPLGPGILGSAGPNTIHRDFPNTLLPNTWYVQALANALAGQDLDPTTSDINATFSSNFSNWYIGLDENPPVGQFDFATVVLHEIVHGLGFLPLVDVLTGEKFLGANDVFMRWLEHHGSSPSDYPSMTDPQRQTASIADPNLHFVGPNLQSASSILTAGHTGTHVHMYAPNPVQPGSSVSHFTNTIKPDQLMEPGISSGKAIHNLGLAKPLLQDLGWGLAIPGNLSNRNDFNGDEKADLVWRNTSSWEVAIWLMNGSSISSSGQLGVIASEWRIVGTGDVNGDGNADIVWRHGISGTVAVWLMNGLTVLSVGFPGSTPTDWLIEGVGDINGDRKADLVWRNTSSLEVAVWLMNGSAIDSFSVLGGVPFEWQIAGTGDTNGDGKADIVWRNANTGTVAVWLMNGLTVLSVGFPGSTPTEWQISGVADVNGGGKADLIWRHTVNGQIVIWLMNGLSMAGSGSLGGVPQEWQIANTGDVDGDGKADVIWRNSNTGTVAVWLMDGLTVLSVGFPSSATTDWIIQD